MTDQDKIEKLWRAIQSMAPAAGPAYSPPWVYDCIDDDTGEITPPNWLLDQAPITPPQTQQ